MRRVIPCGVVWAVLAAATSGAMAAQHVVGDKAAFEKAAKSAAAGDTIVLRDGVWKDVVFTLTAEGTAEKPVTVRAQTLGGVTITGESSMHIAGSYIVVEGLRFERCTSKRDVFEFRTGVKRHARHSRLTQCAFIDCDPPSAKTGTRWISLYGSENRVDHCYTRGKTNQGTTVVVWLYADEKLPVKHRIDSNHFDDRPVLGTNGGETLRIGDSATSMLSAGCIVEGNLFTRCNGEVEIVSNKSCDNIYRSNTFIECEGALTLRHGDRCVVEGNVFLGNGKKRTGGVRIIGEDHRVIGNHMQGLGGDDTRAGLSVMAGIVNTKPSGYVQVKRATVEGNTFVDCREVFVLGYRDGGGTLPPVDSTFSGNVVVNAGELMKVITAPERTVWRDNRVTGGKSGELPTGFTRVEHVEVKPAQPLRPAEVGPSWLKRGG